MVDQVLEVWRTHEEINRLFLTRLPDEAFPALTLLKNGQPSKGRNVARVFAHVHEVRRSRLTRAFLAGVPRFGSGVAPTRQQLIEAFTISSPAVEGRLTAIINGNERIKDRNGLVLLGYLMTHEAHHRGQILLACKQSAIRIPEEFRWDIWSHWFRPAFVTP